MNYLILSKIYNLVEEETECENSKLFCAKAGNYENLKEILDNYEYDYIPDQIVIDARYKTVVEEVVVCPDSITLSIDGKKIKYEEVSFLIKKFCTSPAVIEIKDDKKYCATCFERINGQITFEMVKNILSSKDEMKGLTTTQKIEYILLKNKGKKLTAPKIYELGYPWELKTFTPRNSVYARASTMSKNGIIKKEGAAYYID